MDDLLALGPVLRTQAFGRAHEHHQALASTNARAVQWIRDGAVHGALVTADAQTAGRGRRGRAWHSEPGSGLYATVVVAPGAPAADFGALGLAVGVGLRQALLQFVPDVALKWPNDVLCGGRKLGGVLCEAVWVGAVPKVAVGFGLNIHHRSFPEALRGEATSLSLSGADVGRATVLAAALDALEPVIDGFWQRGFAAVRGQYEAACVTLGQRVRVGDDAQSLLAVGLDPDGALRVAAGPGRPTRRVESGDVWLGPARPR